MVTSQEEIKGVVEKPFFDRDKIRAILNFDKNRCPPDFLEDIRKAEAKQGSPKDVSIGFYYDADYTPGTWRGQRYDMVMRNIVIDHVAAGVWRGRCSWPDCGIGVAKADFKSFQESRIKRIGGKKQVSEQNPDNDTPNFDENGCKIGVEEWDGTKCVPIKKDPESAPETVSKQEASEGESPTAEAPPPVPDDNKAEVDTYGCYIGIETWSEELQRCVPNREPAADIPQGETTPQAASLIARSKKILDMKHQNDVRKLKESRWNPV